jgi:hypothetical protein
MTTSIKKTKQGLVSTAQQLIAGTKLHSPNGSETLAFPGGPRTVTDVSTLLQSAVDNRQAVLAAQAKAAEALAAEEAQTPAILATRREYVRYLRYTYGAQPPVLADYGVTPVKVRTPLSTDAKAAAVAKGLATRKARHTMGKIQKKGVKGAVAVAVVVTPLDGSAPTGTPTAGAAPAGTKP